jgi:hypothetical protein
MLGEEGQEGDPNACMAEAAMLEEERFLTKRWSGSG